MDKPVASMDTVVSTIVVSDIEPWRGVMRDINTPLSELDVHIEEADVRMIPHTLHAVNCGASRVVFLSNDTDVVVLGLHYWNLLKGHGLKELWIRAGVGNTTRYIPLYIITQTLGTEICKVLIALHHLTGCDSTSKFGTKAAGLKSNPAFYLCDFGNDSTNNNFSLVEQFLVNVFKPGTSCTSMDDLRYYLYHHSKKLY